jgi:succinate dehydrogenase / fumarate reductase membrane anchor subunit
MSWRAQGMRTWLLQRLTAIYMLLFGLCFGIYVLTQPIADQASWRGVFANPFVNISTGMFFFSILYHAWVGIRDILIDYINWPAIRFMTWTLVTLFLIIMGIWTAMILYSVVQV